MDSGRPPQLLPVGEGNPSDIDLSRPPTDALEYLRRVRHEADQIPDVVVADVKPSTSSYDKDTNPTLRKVMHEKRTSHLADEDVDDHSLTHFRAWQQEQVACFIDVRQYIRRWKARGKCAPKSTLPKSSDMQNWRQYILGTTNNESVKTETFQGNPPLVYVLAALTQVQIKALLDYSLEWLQEDAVYSDVQGQWLYGLLACLEKPTDADAVACLRSICAACGGKIYEMEKATPNPNCGDAAGLHLFITLVGHYFGQIDLQT